MSAPSSSPAPPPAAGSATPSRSPSRWPDRIITVTSLLAGITLVLLIAGVTLLLIPVRNPGVQDCGAPAAFLLRGRPDVYVDPGNLPKGFTAAQAKAANQHLCRQRVADRAVPGGALLGAGIVLGLGAALAEKLSRSARRRAQGRTGPPEPPTSPSSFPGGPAAELNAAPASPAEPGPAPPAQPG